MPTIVFFLAKMKLVTAGFLWRHGKYAILIAYVIAAVITPTGDPDEPDDFRRPDDRAVLLEHHHRLGGQPAPRRREFRRVGRQKRATR